MFEEWKKRTGLEMREAFGQTELLVTLATFPWMEVKPGSMGKPAPVFDVDLIDSEGKPCPPGVSGEIVIRRLPAAVKKCKGSCVSVKPVPPKKSISDAEVLVVGGRGLAKEADLEMIKELAKLLGGDWAVTRPLVEKGWTTNDRQIGLSGRTVRPRLIITCGVSGAIQFTACMNGSEHIVSINTDKDAPIFDTAHIAIVGDLYEIVPGLIKQLKEGQA